MNADPTLQALRRHEAEEVKSDRDEEKRQSLVDDEKNRLLYSLLGFNELYQERAFEDPIIAKTRDLVKQYRLAAPSQREGLVEDFLHAWEWQAEVLADETTELGDG